MRYQGIGASDGAVVGKTVTFRHHDPLHTKTVDFHSQGVEIELSRFREARQRIFDDLTSMALEAEKKFGKNEAGIFEGYAEILMDNEIEEMTLSFIEEGYNAGMAVKKAIDMIAEEFEALDDDYMKERAADIADIGRRMEAATSGEEQIHPPVLTEPCILVADDLSPFETVKINHKYLQALVVDLGGNTGHVAILARSLGIPCVVGLKNASLSVEDGMVCGVDGGSGLFIINPDQAMIDLLRNTEKERIRKMDALTKKAAEPALTRDGKKIAVCGNIGSFEEGKNAMAHGADGIGLLRTEFLYMNQDTLPSEDEQYERYREILDTLEGRTLTIRTLDVGGDKEYPVLGLGKEQNPYLGYRAIRVGLSKPHILKPQLRAILRTSAAGPVELMFPMVVSCGELRQLKAVLAECRAELENESVPCGNPAVGIMIETPAAAVMARDLAGESDFFSIGTNDLTQYTLAVDRGNPLVAGLYDPLDPAVLRLIAMTCEAAQEKGIPVSMCGELAADGKAAPLLIGMGLEKLSVSSSRIPEIKEILRGIDTVSCRELVGKVLTCSDAAGVHALVGAAL
ncbi:phosphoenolpyruvate--protein phosphotransferase [Breznakiella homolactica]|uniref:Phosphoenolpyruvate-protein phosphotransferase n=1 Tax=Breznakiella homolactica TaxID=2798577 RepID=A0A7T7XR18_9SPIR|nr:phosphoenolpyruvate--protein phosphotransferase [Breznakiella homolactica]QQO10920.1 phosphoenolpyruvate--protein phosphotransferase [Breznakiella homolactica]